MVTLTPFFWYTVSVKQHDGSYTTQNELFIETDPREIYDVLVDFNRRHLWWKTNRAELLNGEKVQEGSRVIIRARHRIFPVRFLMRIEKLEPPRLIRLGVEEGPIQGHCEWQIESEKRGALVRLVWKGVRPRGLLGRWMFALSGEQKHRQHAAHGLEGLKAYLLSSPPRKRTA